MLVRPPSGAWNNLGHPPRQPPRLHPARRCQAPGLASASSWSARGCSVGGHDLQAPTPASSWRRAPRARREPPAWSANTLPAQDRKRSSAERLLRAPGSAATFSPLSASHPPNGSPIRIRHWPPSALDGESVVQIRLQRLAVTARRVWRESARTARWRGGISKTAFPCAARRCRRQCRPSSPVGPAAGHRQHLLRRRTSVVRVEVTPAADRADIPYRARRPARARGPGARTGARISTTAGTRSRSSAAIAFFLCSLLMATSIESIDRKPEDWREPH